MYMDSTFIQHFQDLRDPRLFAIANQTRVGKEEGKAEKEQDPEIPAECRAGKSVCFSKG